MDRVLFIPSDHGGGMGHVSRCLFFARQLEKQNVPTAIVLEPYHYKTLKGISTQRYLLNTHGERWLAYHLTPPFRDGVRLTRFITRRPVFVEFTDLSFQIPRDGYVNPEIVNRRFRQLISIAETFKPSVLVGDTHFLTRFLGVFLDIPVVQITRQAGYPPKPQFVWWKSISQNIHPPAALEPFKMLLDQFPLNDVRRIEDLLRGNRYIIPAIPEIESIQHDTHTVFAGPFVEQINDFHLTEKVGERRVYVTIGGGAGKGPVKIFFKEIVKIFGNQPFRVVLSTGGKIPARRVSNSYSNIKIYDWVDGRKVIAQSDVVIFHGGYGTSMEILSLGKPAIVIPTHTEQEGNGRRLEQLGIGHVCLMHRPEELEPLPFRWRYGKFQMLGAFSFQLNGEELLDQTIRLLEAPPKQNIQDLQKKLLDAQQRTDFKRLIEF